MEELTIPWPLSEVRWSLAQAGVQVERFTDDDIQENLLECYDNVSAVPWPTPEEFRRAAIQNLAMRLDGHDFIWFASQEHESEYRRLMERQGQCPDAYMRAFLT